VCVCVCEEVSCTLQSTRVLFHLRLLLSLFSLSFCACLFERVLGKEGGKVDASALGEGPLAGPCEHGNEPSDSIKGGEFLDLLSDY